MRVFLCALGASLLLAGTSDAQNTPPPDQPPLLAVNLLWSNGPPQDRAELTSFRHGARPQSRGPVTRFGQADWGDRWLRRYGCVTTVIASIATDAGQPMTPPALRARLKRGKMYTGNSLFGLRSDEFRPIHGVVPAIRFTGRRDVDDVGYPAFMREIQTRLARGEYVALKIRKPRSGGEHWVRVYGFGNNDLKIMDPAKKGGWTGFLSSRYVSPKKVVHEAVFFKKNVS